MENRHNPPEFDPEKIKVRGDRGRYDKETIFRIIDHTLISNVSYIDIDGEPNVIPTMHWRIEDRLYWHGSSASTMLRNVVNKEVCIALSKIYGFVLARSGFNHSMNFESVVLYGKAEIIDDLDRKNKCLDCLIDHWFPGRSEKLRLTTKKELRATTLLCLPINHTSAKIRTGPPVEDESDYSHPVWAGEIPLKLVAETPRPCPKLKSEHGSLTEVSSYIDRFINLMKDN